jgi:hypothetical protein
VFRAELHTGDRDIFNEYDIIANRIGDLSGSVYPDFLGMFGSSQADGEMWVSIWRDGGESVQVHALSQLQKLAFPQLTTLNTPLTLTGRRFWIDTTDCIAEVCCMEILRIPLRGMLPWTNSGKLSPIESDAKQQRYWAWYELHPNSPPLRSVVRSTEVDMSRKRRNAAWSL